MSDLGRSLRIRDFAWLTLAALLGLLFVLNIADVFVAIARHQWADLLGVPIAMLFFYWTAAGAWRRTLWGARRRRGCRTARWIPWVPLLLAFPASSALLVHFMGRRPLDCSSDESLATS